MILVELKNFFGTADRVFNNLCLPEDDLATTHRLIDAARQYVNSLDLNSPAATSEKLAGVTTRITIREASVEIQVSKEGARKRLLNPDKAFAQEPQEEPRSGQDLIILRVPANLKRCGREMRLIIPGPAANHQRQQPVPSLIKAISRAHEWIRRIEAGEFKDHKALAAATGLAPRYIRFILRTAFVAPEIVEAILEGRQPPDLTLALILRGIPLSWREQKKMMGWRDMLAEQLARGRNYAI